MHPTDTGHDRNAAARQLQLPLHLLFRERTCHVPDRAIVHGRPEIVFGIRTSWKHPRVRDETFARLLFLLSIVEECLAGLHRPIGKSRSTSHQAVPNVAGFVGVFEFPRADPWDEIAGHGRLRHSPVRRARRPPAPQAKCLCYYAADSLPPRSAARFAKTTCRSSSIRKLRRLAFRLETPGLDKKSAPRSGSPASSATSQHRHLYLRHRRISRSA